MKFIASKNYWKIVEHNWLNGLQSKMVRIENAFQSHGYLTHLFDDFKDVGCVYQINNGNKNKSGLQNIWLFPNVCYKENARFSLISKHKRTVCYSIVAQHSNGAVQHSIFENSYRNDMRITERSIIKALVRKDNSFTLELEQASSSLNFIKGGLRGNAQPCEIHAGIRIRIQSILRKCQDDIQAGLITYDDIKIPWNLELSQTNGNCIVYNDNNQAYPVSINCYSDQRAFKAEDCLSSLFAGNDSWKAIEDWLVSTLYNEMFLCNRKLVIANYKNFIDCLEPDILREALKFKEKNSSINQLKVYNWLLAEGSRIFSAKRLQAIQAFPIPIYHVIEKNNKAKPNIFKRFTQTGLEINNCIDQGKPLIPLLSRTLNIPAQALKTLNAVYNAEISKKFSIYSKLDTMDIPRESWPNASRKIPLEEQWKRFLTVACFANACVFSKTNRFQTGYVGRYSLLNLHNQSHPIVRAGSRKNSFLLYSSSKNVFSRSDWWTNPNLNDDMANKIQDMCLVFARNCLLPIIYDQFNTLEYDPFCLIDYPFENSSVLERTLICDRSPVQLLELSERWHRMQNNFIFDREQGFSWPSFFDDQNWNDLTIKGLYTSQALTQEGEQMKHCVRAYSNQCAAGKSAIYTISRGREKLSTLELRVNASKQKFTLAQNYSIKNTQPEIAAQQAAEWLLKSLNDGSIRVDWQKCREEFRLIAKQRSQNIKMQSVGYNPDNYSAREHAFEQWKFTRLKADKTISLAQWSEQLELPLLFNRILDEIRNNQGKP